MLKWLDENLEEFLMVALLIAMTVIMGNPGICKICTWSFPFMVRGTDKIFVYLVRLYQC
nr:hypothetical protein [Anaerostipes hadrus]